MRVVCYCVPVRWGLLQVVHVPGTTEACTAAWFCLSKLWQVRFLDVKALSASSTSRVSSSTLAILCASTCFWIKLSNCNRQLLLLTFPRAYASLAMQVLQCKTTASTLTLWLITSRDLCAEQCAGPLEPDQLFCGVNDLNVINLLASNWLQNLSVREARQTPRSAAVIQFRLDCRFWPTTWTLVRPVSGISCWSRHVDALVLRGLSYATRAGLEFSPSPCFS